MAGPSRIRTPLVQRWHRFRQQVLPIVCFVAGTAFTLWLWVRQANFGNGTGEIVAVRVDVTSGAAGLLVSRSPLPTETGQNEPYWALFDRVQQGDVIAQLDDRLLEAELKSLKAEVVRLQKELEATRQQLVFDQANTQHEHQFNVDRERVQRQFNYEQISLNLLDRHVQVVEDRLELARLDALLTLLKEGIDSLQKHNVQTSGYQSTDLEKQREVVKGRLAENEDACAQLGTLLQNAKKRLKEFPESPTPPAVEQLLAPVQEAISVQNARIDELALRMESLTIKAPISGTIMAIYSRPGQTVQPGTPVATIASDHGEYIVSYVRQAQRIRPEPGMKVQLRTREPGSRTIPSVVEDVGVQFEPVPSQQLSDPTIPEWGLPVRIRLPVELRARPGETLDIVFPPRPHQSP